MSPAKKERRSLYQWLIGLAALIVLHNLSAIGLDAIGLAESVLSPSLGRALGVGIAALVFFAARLFLFFIAPGVVLAKLVRRAFARPSGPDADLIKATE